MQLSLTKETKATLADIYYPEELKDKNYDAVKTTLLDHYKDKKLTLVYREKFNQRVQQEGETCKKYFESLRELAGLCDYSAEFYKEQMYDRSIVGLTNEMWKANLSMKDRTTHTYQQIQTLAIQYEEHKLTAEKLRPGNTTGGKSSATTVASVNTYQQKKRFNTYKQKNYGKSNNHNRKSGYNNQSKMCYRCLKGPHNPNDCWYKNAKCDKCMKTGHLTKAHKDSWHKNSSSGQNNVYHTKQDNTSKNTNKKVHHVENYDDSDETSSDEIAFCKVIKNRKL